MFSKPFIDACMSGDAFLDDLDDYIDYWHEKKPDISLRGFLGLTEYEYGEWLKNDDTIMRDILRCRRDCIDFKDYPYMDEQAKIAARSYDEQTVEKLKAEESRKQNE